MSLSKKIKVLIDESKIELSKDELLPYLELIIPDFEINKKAIEQYISSPFCNEKSMTKERCLLNSLGTLFKTGDGLVLLRNGINGTTKFTIKNEIFTLENEHVGRIETFSKAQLKYIIKNTYQILNGSIKDFKKQLFKDEDDANFDILLFDFTQIYKGGKLAGNYELSGKERKIIEIVMHPPKDEETSNLMKTDNSRQFIKVKEDSLEIRLNFDSLNKGYNILKSPLIHNFIIKQSAKGNNLIHTLPDKPFKAHGNTILYLRGKNFTTWPKKMKWKKIKCKTFIKNWVKGTPCTIGSSIAKVYVKINSTSDLAGFGAYLEQLFEGNISKESHIQFIEILQNIMGDNLIINHNEDVSWFQLKAVSKSEVKLNIKKVRKLIRKIFKGLSAEEREDITIREVREKLAEKIVIHDDDKKVLKQLIIEISEKYGSSKTKIYDELLDYIKELYDNESLELVESDKEFTKQNIKALNVKRLLPILAERLGYDVNIYKKDIKKWIKTIISERLYFTPPVHSIKCKKRSPKKLLKLQKKVINFINKHPALLVAQGVGCGKTLEGIVASQCYLDKHPTHQVLFIVPASVTEMWKDGILAMTKYPDPRNKIYSYEKFAQLNPAEIDCQNTMLILDEAHRIRNFKTRNSKAVVACAQKADKRLLLTATPFINSLYDFVPIINIIHGENIAYAGRKPSLEPGEVVPSIKIGKTLTQETRSNLYLALNQKVDYIENCSDRFPDEFPEKEEKYYAIPMSAKYYEDYNKAIMTNTQFEEMLREKLRGNLSIEERNRILTEISQIVDPELWKKTEATPWEKPEIFYHGYRQAVGKTSYHSLKMSKAIKIITEKMSDRNKKIPKTIIFTNWHERGTQVLDKIIRETSKKLKKEGMKKSIKFGIFDGKKNKTQRQELIKNYNKGKIKILVITRAGAEGLDLKGTRNIIILDPVWNPAMMTQIIGRGIRRGSHTHLPPSQRNVSVYKLVLTFPGIRDWEKTRTQRPYNEDLPLHTQLTGDQILYRIISKKSGLQNEIDTVLNEVKIN